MTDKKFHLGKESVLSRTKIGDGAVEIIYSNKAVEQVWTDGRFKRRYNDGTIAIKVAGAGVKMVKSDTQDYWSASRNIKVVVERGL